MNKNTIFAFLLISLAVIFFYSPQWNKFWYGTVLKKPVPTYQTSKPRPAESQAPSSRDSADIRVIPPDAKAETPDRAEAAIAGKDGANVDTSANRADGAEDSASVVQVAADTVIVETDKLVAAVSTEGGRLVSLRMKDYKYGKGEREGEMIDVLPQGSVGGAQLTINSESFDDKFFTVMSEVDTIDGEIDITNGSVNNNTDSIGINGNINIDTSISAYKSTASTPAPAEKKRKHVTVSADGYDLILETTSASGRPLQKVFSFSDGTYKIGYTVRGAGVAGQKVALGWAGGIEEPEFSKNMPFGQMMDRRRAHYSDGKNAYHFEMNKKNVEQPSGMYRWVGMSSKYLFIAVVAEKVSDADLKIEGRVVSGASSKDIMIDYSLQYQFQAASDEVHNWVYAGPNGIRELSHHKMKFEKALFPVISWARYILWADVWFPPLAELILWTLLFLYGLVKDYGVAIFLLTLLSKLITYPMTQSSTKSMMRMKEVQPKLVALRAKYKSNPQKMNEEMMALYKAEGINPFNPGCLPMFLQMPIFIALFIVLRKAIELRGASSFLLPWVGDLSQPEALFLLPFTIPIYGSNVALLPIVMAALTFFQQKAAIQDPNQKAMIYMMPVIMLVMFNGFPAGVVFYWTMSSAISLAQQKWLPPKGVKKPNGAAANGEITQAQSTTAPANVRHKAPVKKKSGGKKRSKR